ncbi:uncharacterized protein ACIBXB_018863 isoform 1-T2 [Morphnus guianensis]
MQQGVFENPLVVWLHFQGPSETGAPAPLRFIPQERGKRMPRQRKEGHATGNGSKTSDDAQILPKRSHFHHSRPVRAGSAVTSPWLCSYPRRAASLRLLPSTVSAFLFRLRSLSSFTQRGPEVPPTRTKRLRAMPWSEPRNSRIMSREPSTQDRNSIRYQSVCNTGGPLAFIICPTDTYSYVITQTFSEGRAEVHKAFFQAVMLFGGEAIRNPPEIWQECSQGS